MGWLAEFRCGRTDAAIRHLTAAIDGSSQPNPSGQHGTLTMEGGDAVAELRDLRHSLDGVRSVDPRALYYAAVAVRDHGEAGLARQLARLGDRERLDRETLASPADNAAIRRARREDLATDR